MKKLLLTTVTMFGLTLFLCAQTTLVTQVPQISNGNSTLRAPNGTAAHTSLRAHFLLTATELASVPSGNNITQLGFVLNNGIASGASNGTLKLYLEATSDVTNTKSTTWTTAVASMTEVYNSTYTIPISATATNIDLVLALPFAYTGTGLYVAYEYVAASTSTTPANYASNTDLASGLKMIDGTTTTPGATLTGSSSFRPCMRIGIPNPNSNDVEVRGILSPVGKVSSAIQSSQDIVAIIGNASNTALTNVPVTMSVSGPNPSSTIQTIASIAAGQEVNVTFSGLATTSNTIQTVSISVPNDDDNSDNLLLYDQSISCDTIGYYNTDGAFGAVGYNTGSGCLANRHVIPNTTPVTIKSIGMVLNDDNVAVGNTMKGILFNSQGLPIDSSNLVTLTTAMLGNRVAFDLIHADSNLAGDTVFIGVRQYANTTTGYFPCATQIDDYATLDRYFSLNVNGGNVTALNTLGLFMIDAIVEPLFNLESNAGSLVCSGTLVQYDATPGYSNYSFFVDGVSSGSSSSFNFTPTDTHTILATANLNSCSFQDSLIIAVQQPDTTNVSVTICAGQSYSFDGQTLTTSGAYSATFASVFGCDSTVNLALNIGGLIEQNLQVQICDGETYQHLGQTLSTSGTYIDTLVASGGCDSVVSLDLTVNAPIISSISETICSYDTYSFNGQILTTAGTYSDTLQSALGCDSVISLLLTVTEIDLGIMQSGFELTVNESGATYQWLKCPNNEVVTGATEQTQDFEQSGSYRVVVTKLGCTDTSECQYVTGLGIGAINNPLAVKVYPNPTQNMVTITAKEKIESVKIIDISGKTVFELNNATNQDKVDLDVSSLSSGIYTVLTYTANQVVPNYNLLTKQ